MLWISNRRSKFQQKSVHVPKCGLFNETMNAFDNLFTLLEFWYVSLNKGHAIWQTPHIVCHWISVEYDVIKQLDFNGQKVINISICHHCDDFWREAFLLASCCDVWNYWIEFVVLFGYLSLEYSHLSALKLRTSNCYMSQSPSLSNWISVKAFSLIWNKKHVMTKTEF